MKLVDIDEFELTRYEPQNDLAYALGWNDCVDDIEEELSTMQEVKAIPIEWLKRRRDIYLKAYHAGHESEIHTAVILNDTLMAWLKEQGEKENEENTDN